jgi:hypothetical protein
MIWSGTGVPPVNHAQDARATSTPLTALPPTRYDDRGLSGDRATTAIAFDLS